MQKSIIILIVSGALIGIALILLVLGNQMILEGINQGNGKISQSQSLIISAEFDIQETTQGVFAVQIIDFKDNTLTAKILDPLDIEIISQIINEEAIEKEFDIVDTGIYKLVIENDLIIFGNNCKFSQSCAVRQRRYYSIVKFSQILHWIKLHSRFCIFRISCSGVYRINYLACCRYDTASMCSKDISF